MLQLSDEIVLVKTKQLLQQRRFSFGKQRHIYLGADMEIETRAKHLKKKRALLKSSITQLIIKYFRPIPKQSGAGV